MEFDHSSLPRSRPRPRSAVEPPTQFLSPIDPSLSSYSFPPAPRTADGLGSFTQSTPSLSFSSPPKSPVFDFSFEPPMLSHFLSPEDRCDTPTEELRPRYEAYQFSPPKPRREETNNLQFSTLGQAVYDGRDASEILSSFSFSKLLNPLSIRQDRSPPPPPSAGLHPDKCRLSPNDAVPSYYRAAVSPRDLARVEPTFESPVERIEPQSSRYSFPSPLSNSHHSPSWPELPPPEPHRYYRGGDHEDSTFAPPREYEPTFAKPKLGPPISIVPSSSTSSSSISSYDSHTSSSKRSYPYSLPIPPPHHLHHRSPSPQTSRKKKKNHKTCPSSSKSVPNNRSVVGLYRPSPQSMLAPEAVREVTINLGPSSLSLTPPKPKSARIKHTTTTTTGEGGGGVVGQRGGRAWNAPTLPEGIDFEKLPTKNSRGRKPPTFSSTVPASSSSSTIAEEEASENRRGTGERVEDGSKGKKRQWVCQVKECGKTFKRGEHLQRHVRSIHTGEKPFQCQWPQCGKYFSRHDNLNQHLRVHKDSNWTDEEFSSRIRECFDRRLVEVEREAAEIARENAERAKRERRGEEVGNEEGEGSRIGYTPMALPSLIEDQTTTTNTPIVDPGRFRRRGDGDEERERKKRRIDSRTNVRDYADSSDELLDDDDEEDSPFGFAPPVRPSRLI